MAFGFLKRSLSLFKSFGNRNNAVITRNGVNGAGGPENGNVKLKTVIISALPPGHLDAPWEEELDEVLGRRKYPRVLIHSPEVIKFLVPTPVGLNLSQISMKIGIDNKFVFASQDPNKPYVKFLYLPSDDNFEKAVFKTKFEDGWAHVTITNFEKKDVVVEFNSFPKNSLNLKTYRVPE